jgi:hypothetical protein
MLISATALMSGKKPEISAAGASSPGTADVNASARPAISGKTEAHHVSDLGFTYLETASFIELSSWVLLAIQFEVRAIY